MTYIHLLGVSGKQYSGKDVLADLLVKALPGFKKVPLALAIKQAYAEQNGLSVEEIEANKAEHRPGLIALGDWGRRQDTDYWLKKVLATPGDKIISDVRLRPEYELLKSHGAFLIRMEAERAVRADRGRLVSETDLTECDLDGFDGWDAVIHNNGSLADLEAQVAQLCQQRILNY